MDFVIPPIITPVGLAVLGALLWWRMSRVESEIMRLRDDRHEIGNKVAGMQGAVNTLKEVVVDVLRAR